MNNTSTTLARKSGFLHDLGTVAMRALRLTARDPEAVRTRYRAAMTEFGERYVALDPPSGQSPQGRLAPGTEIPLGDTHVVPDVEVEQPEVEFGSEPPTTDAALQKAVEHLSTKKAA